jgi:hypothetical protein
MKLRAIFASYALIAGAIVIALSGCAHNETIVGTEQITGSGRIVSEARIVPSFTGIRITNYANVIITQDTVESLRIEADDNILYRVQTQVVGGVLIVGMPEGSYNNITLIVHASMRNVLLLESTGAADFTATNPITSDDLTCRITGAGSITLSGRVGLETIAITGAGNVHNYGLAALRCSALISGAGSIEVTVTQSLDATIMGTGSITYAGNPTVVNRSVVGVGAIKPL